MLKENKFKMGDYIIVRLVSGEELIAKVDSVSEKSVSIVKPLMMGLTQQPNGQPAVGLAPFVFGIDETKPITIDSSKWIFVAPARKEAADQYIASTTKVVPASALDLSNIGG